MIISYIKTPSAHQSRVWSCPQPTIISGEMYSGVPQKVFGSDPSSAIFILANPKSANRIYPSTPNKIFSGLRSL